MAAALTAALATSGAAVAHAAPGSPGHGRDGRATSAWKGGELQVDTAGVVSRSDLVLEDPAWHEPQSMPLGNGRLGAAVWSRDGFTAQLNRNDTFPDLKSAGRLSVPGLFRLASAADYDGRLALHDAELRQRGGGMTARAYVRADSDQLVLEVTGAPAGERQTAELRLPAARRPATSADGGIAALAETFSDARSGVSSGAVAAITAKGRDVRAEAIDGTTVRISFLPERDGSFRVVAGVPTYNGGDVAAAARDAVAGAGGPASKLERPHRDWWHAFWEQAAPLRVDSPDGVGEYMEALRAQQLYTTAATQRNAVPTGQAGAANMLNPWPDGATSPSTWFHFNVRQQVFANFGAGTASFNDAYLRLYTDRLARLRAWTQANWPGAEGTCVPELIRFDGSADGCVAAGEPSWTNRILTGGLEVSHDIWQQYRHTGDPAVLRQGYPLMSEVARFYLSQLRAGADGLLHLNNVNAFETQWGTTDPAPDLAGMRVVFPIVARLAAERGDGELAARLRDAHAKLPPLPTTSRGGEQVLAWSATDEPAKNTQNVELEALVPWGVLGADSPLMQASFRQRVFPLTREWNEDPIWAARLHLPDEMRTLLVQGTDDLQKYPNGFTVHGKNDDPLVGRHQYSSWNAIVASALQEGLVQSYDGTVRIAASVPRGWNVSGSVEIGGGHRVSTQLADGVPTVVGIEAGASERVTIANPWPGAWVRVVAADRRGRGHGRGGHGGDGGGTVVRPTRAATVDVPLQRGRAYTLERVARPAASFRFGTLAGAPASTVKRLGERTLGVASGQPSAQIASDLVANVAPEKLHALTPARVGAQLYVDRSDTIAALPPALEGATTIRGATADARVTAPTDYLSFDLSRPAPVAVAIDARGEGRWWPAWLTEQGFERSGTTVATRDYLQRFQIQGGKVRASGGGVTLTRAGSDWGDQVVEVSVHQVQVGAAVVFRAPDSRNGYVWQLGGPLGSPGGLGQLRMSVLVNGRSTLLGSVSPIRPAPGHTYRLRIEAIGDRIRTFVDGTLVDERTDATHAAGRVGVSLGGSDVGVYDDWKVTNPAGATLFEERFDGDLSAWDVPAGRQDNPLVVFTKQFPAGRVTLGPPSGISGQGDAPYVTFVGGR
ncbi:hypothetical protein VSS74_02560 [Conexibacter stalactiti]|uniref:Glycosyl hydrolase family 95 catalytic domain-containing protein n=2 Tax=Conexibacter stalactiti TaxID=1940611 RepID=A0ABU4HIQ8_9ACTN|nr:hypothetical protein [Conexibacter stalactiti]MEC5033844.1 hypothetical protein [Conexibacter stalactiti]